MRPIAQSSRRDQDQVKCSSISQVDSSLFVQAFFILSVMHADGMMQQACDECGSILLDWVGTQYFCLSCMGTFQRYAHELRAVPTLHSPQPTPQELDNQRKLNSSIAEFTDKYKEVALAEDLAVLRQRIRRLREENPKGRNVRDIAAVVVYMSLRNEIGLKPRQFCIVNNLKQKNFNQHYIRYSQIIQRRPELVVGADGMVQIQMSREEGDREREKKDERGQCDALQHSLEQNKRYFEGVFDHLFKSKYLKNRKTAIVTRIMALLAVTKPAYLVAIDFAYESPHKLYYTVFGLMKWLGMRITPKDFYLAVRKETNFRLNHQKFGSYQKAYLSFHQSQEQGHENEEKGESRWWDIKVQDYHRPEANHEQQKPEQMVFEEYISPGYSEPEPQQF